MAIQCTLEKSRTDEKYFARARKTGKVGMKEIAEEIQRNCSATCSDVTLVLTELMDVIRDHLLNGEEVTIDVCIPVDTRSPFPVIPVHSVGNLQYMWQS